MLLFTDKIGNLEPEKSFTVACPFRVDAVEKRLVIFGEQ